jgi:hypothetical protein
MDMPRRFRDWATLPTTVSRARRINKWRLKGQAYPSGTSQNLSHPDIIGPVALPDVLDILFFYVL